MKIAIYILVLLSLILTACRTSKELTTDTKQKEQRNIESNISLVDTSSFDQVVSEAMQKFFNEKLSIQVHTKVYDTDKPVDIETGKPPLKEETNINLSKETNEQLADSTTIKTNESARSELIDKSKDKSKLETAKKTTEKKGFTLWEILGLSVAVSLFAGFVLFLVHKFK